MKFGIALESGMNCVIIATYDDPLSGSVAVSNRGNQPTKIVSHGVIAIPIESVIAISIESICQLNMG